MFPDSPGRAAGSPSCAAIRRSSILDGSIAESSPIIFGKPDCGCRPMVSPGSHAIPSPNRATAFNGSTRSATKRSAVRRSISSRPYDCARRVPETTFRCRPGSAFAHRPPRPANRAGALHDRSRPPAPMGKGKLGKVALPLLARTALDRYLVQRGLPVTPIRRNPAAPLVANREEDRAGLEPRRL